MSSAEQAPSEVSVSEILRGTNYNICASLFPSHFTDSKHEDNILSLLSRKDFGSFRQSVKKEHINTLFSGKKSLLHYTVTSGDADSVERVLSLGADVNCKTARGYTPLIIAVLQRSV